MRLVLAFVVCCLFSGCALLSEDPVADRMARQVSAAFTEVLCEDEVESAEVPLVP